MKKVILILLAVLVVVAAVLFVRSCRDDSDAYLVRAVFDNGGFVVPNVDVRVAGANVGSVKSIDVSMPDEEVSTDPGDEVRPGKAIVVMKITDEAFQDFRDDASCIIRPQSLIGEKFIDCSVTQPRAAGTEAPPELQKIPDGQPGAGQYLLPLENNGKSVDQDLIANIYRLPYAQRFRIILNELGAGLATRGDELNETITRANPTLMQVNRVLEKLSSQNKRLAQLARDGDNNLTPLAEKRKNMVGFFRGAGTTAGAQAEVSEDMRANIANLPATLRELRQTFNAMDTFASAALPVFTSLRPNAEQISKLNTNLGPFAQATKVSLTSLGKATRTAGPDLVASRPIIQKLGRLAKRSKANSRNLNFFLKSTRQADGFENLMKLFYSTASSLNGFDQFGHYQRTNLIVTGCSPYRRDWESSCTAGWSNSRPGSTSLKDYLPMLEEEFGPMSAEALNGETGPTGDTGVTEPDQPIEPGDLPDPSGTTDGSDTSAGSDDAVNQSGGSDGATGATGAAQRSMTILDYLLGS